MIILTVYRNVCLPDPSAHLGPLISFGSGCKMKEMKTSAINGGSREISQGSISVFILFQVTNTTDQLSRWSFPTVGR